MLFVTCAEYNRCKPYSEILTYKPITNNSSIKITREAIYRGYWYRVNVRGHQLVEVIEVICTCRYYA